MKILIGCPTYSRYRYCVDEWLERVKEIINHSKEHEIDYILVDNSKEDDFFNELKQKANIVKSPYFNDVKQRIAYSRNLLRQKVLDEDYDYFFSLEQDVIPKKDILEKLLKANKKIISAYYSKPVLVGLKDKETGEIHNAFLELALIWLKVKEKNRVKRALPQQVKNKGISEVGGFGIGCALISRNVLKKIKFKFIENKKAFDDLLFCEDAENNGYQLFLDSDIQVKHLHKPWTEKEYA